MSARVASLKMAKEAAAKEASPAEPPATGRKSKSKVAAPPAMAAVNETLSLAKGADVLLLAEPGAYDADDDDDTLIDAVNKKTALAFRTDLSRAVSVRVTGKNLSAQDADHALGSHHWYVVKTGADALELRPRFDVGQLVVDPGRVPNAVADFLRPERVKLLPHLDTD